VQGLSVAPNGNYLCSYVDSVIMLWDLRAIERPLRQIQSSRNHMQIAWCPTRTSLLSSLQRDSPYITLYDIRSVDNETSREVYHVKRQISPFPAKYQHIGKFASVNWLSWHPRDFERMLLLADALNILDFRLPASLHTAYSNRSKLPLLMQRPLYAPAPNVVVPTSPTTTTQPPTTSSCSSHSSLNDYNAGSSLSFDFLERELLEEDLLEETRQRALQDYGMKPDNKRFAEIHLSPYLRNVWTTLSNVFCEERLTGLNYTLEHISEPCFRVNLEWPDGINNSNQLISYR